MLPASLLAPLPAQAQQDAPAPSGSDAVSYDEVNDVAARLYCPICENEPLDTCRATTCIEWREQIREQLEEGRTSDEIVAYFVETYGDRVVGIPADNRLRLLSLLGPVVMVVAAVGIGSYTLMRWRRSSAPTTPEHVTYRNAVVEDQHDANYRSRLEEDLDG
ncbi:MAG: hypothetical protein OHK0046_32480 [Anaerolineae bacterium]